MMIKDKDRNIYILGKGELWISTKIKNNTPYDVLVFRPVSNVTNWEIEGDLESLEFIFNAYSQGFRAIDLSNEKLRLKLKETEDKRNGLD